MVQKLELEKLEQQILPQLPVAGALPVFDRPSLLDKIRNHENTMIHIADEIMSLPEACTLCEDTCYPLNCNEDLARAIAEGYIKNKKS